MWSNQEIARTRALRKAPNVSEACDKITRTGSLTESQLRRVFNLKTE